MSSSNTLATVGPADGQKVFTLEEANRAVPLVRRIIKDLVAQADELTRIQQAAQQANAAGDSATFESLGEQRDRAVSRIERFAEELEEIGCILKDAYTGLVDFPAWHEDRIVYLCWQLGEGDVTHWHEIDAGFSGRQPVAALE